MKIKGKNQRRRRRSKRIKAKTEASRQERTK